jgi:hypothetical protein
MSLAAELHRCGYISVFDRNGKTSARIFFSLKRDMDACITNAFVCMKSRPIIPLIFLLLHYITLHDILDTLCYHGAELVLYDKWISLDLGTRKY